MSQVPTLFGKHKAIIGMIHLPPLPGTPFFRNGTFAETLEIAVQSARALYDGGATGCLIQTVDRVYTPKDESDPARVVAIGLILAAIKQSTGEDFHIGVQIMRNALKASMAVAKIAGGTFIRAGSLVGATLTDHGIVESNPLEVMEYRTKIDAWDIGIIADVDSPHFKWLGGVRTSGEVAKGAKLVGADAVCLGDRDETKTLETIASVRNSIPGFPIILAGHTNHENAERMLALVEGAFVGACLQRGGWGGQIDIEKVKEYVQIVRRSERKMP